MTSAIFESGPGRSTQLREHARQSVAAPFRWHLPVAGKALPNLATEENPS